MSNAIIIDNNPPIFVPPKQAVYFGHKTAKPEHTFFDVQSGERFLFLPPNIGNNPAAWNAFVKLPNYGCSVCDVQIFHNALCSVLGADDIDAPNLYFYCNPECHKVRVELDLTFEEHKIHIRDAEGGIEVGQVLDALSEALDISPNALSLGNFERDDCIGQVLRSNDRTIVARGVAAPQVAPGLEAFGPFRGTDELSANNIHFDQLTNINSTVVFGAAIHFLHRYYNDPTMPAILGNVNYGVFYVNRLTNSLHFFLGPGMQLVPGGDKYRLCKDMVRLLLSKRAEKYIQKDENWAPWYHAVKSVKAAEQGVFGSDPNALRKLLRQLPVREVIDLVEAAPVAPVEEVQEAAVLRQHSIQAASGLPKITKSSRPPADQWFAGYKELVRNMDVLLVPRAELNPIHVVLEDGHIHLSRQVNLVPGTLEQKRAFLTQIAQWMTLRWKGKQWLKDNPALADFKRVVDSNQLDEWFENFNIHVADPLWGLRQQVEAAWADAGVAQDEGKMHRLMAIFGVEHSDQDAEMVLELGSVNEQQLRQMLALAQESDKTKTNVPSKPQTHEELKQLAEQTLQNTNAALDALNSEMRALSGKVLEHDHPVAQHNGSSAVERYSLNEEFLRKQIEAQMGQEFNSSDDEDDSDSLMEEEGAIETLTRAREEDEEEEHPTKRNRVSVQGRELSRDEHEVLRNNNRAAYNELSEMFPGDENRQTRYDMIGHDGISEVKW